MFIDEEELQKKLAMFHHTGEKVNDIDGNTSSNLFTAGSEEYLVLTDDEADDAEDTYLENYIDDVLDADNTCGFYFDRESWKDDAKIDGRGHSLATYDGDECSVNVNFRGEDNTFYLYRIS